MIHIKKIPAMVLAAILTLSIASQAGIGIGSMMEIDGPYYSTAYKGAPDTFVDVSISGGLVYAVKSDGSLWGWGNNQTFMLGSDDIDRGDSWGVNRVHTAPIHLMDGIKGVTLSTSGNQWTFALALAADNTVWSWGYNGGGELGRDTDTLFDFEPQRIAGLDDVVSISAGNGSAMAITEDGSLWAWGNNEYGQLGDGTQTRRPGPVKVMDGAKKALPGNDAITLILKNDGTVWACGALSRRADYYENYAGNQEHIVTAIPRMISSDVSDIAVNNSDNDSYCVIVHNDGTANFIGYANSFDISMDIILETDSTHYDWTLDATKTIFELQGVKSAAGGSPPAILLNDGSLYAYGVFGLNRDGAWTDGPYSSKLWGSDNEPMDSFVKLIDGASGIEKFATGHSNDIAVILEDGSLWMYSWNNTGQLGNGTLVSAKPTYFAQVRAPDGINGIIDDAVSPWAYDTVKKAIAESLVPQELQIGYRKDATRAGFCALAATLYEQHAGSAIYERVGFADTDDINVEKMAAIGVVLGVGDNLFAPHEKLTREQAAVMLANLAKVMGKPLEATAATFADADSVSPWAVESVGQVQSSGIMYGIGDSAFASKAPYTWEQSIITMLRLYEYIM